jgi:hypothetical protein
VQGLIVQADQNSATLEAELWSKAPAASASSYRAVPLSSPYRWFPGPLHASPSGTAGDPSRLVTMAKRMGRGSPWQRPYRLDHLGVAACDQGLLQACKNGLLNLALPLNRADMGVRGG